MLYQIVYQFPALLVSVLDLKNHFAFFFFFDCLLGFTQSFPYAILASYAVKPGSTH